MTKINQIAQAFAQGVKFAENLKLAMDAAKGKDDENGHWVTIGEGEEARPVFIKGKKKAAKTESKKDESKKAESKPAQQRNESWREMEARHRQEVAARANRSQEDIEAAHQVFLKFDRSAMRTMMEVSGVTFPAQQRMRDIIRGEIPGADGSAEKSIKDSLRQIRSNIDAFGKTMSKIQSRIAKAASDGKIGEDRANAELRDYRRYYKTFADYIVRASKQMNNLDHTTNDGHREDREVLSKIAGLTSEMVKSAADWRESLENKAHEQNAERTESHTTQSQPRARRSASNEAETVKALKDAYNVSADLIDEITPKQSDRPFLSRLDRIHKDAVALAESAPEINNSYEIREMTRIMKQADKLVKALPSYYDRNYYGGWVQNIMGKVRAAEEAYTKLKKRKALGPDAAI